MSGSITDDTLPSPSQMRNLAAAAAAAWQASRLRESARAVATGNIALGICVFGVVLAIVHSDRMGAAAPFVMCGIVCCYLLGLVFSLRWMVRRRARSSVTVIDQRELELRKSVARPRWTAAVLFATVAVQFLIIAGGSIAFRQMSSSTILTALALGPALGLLYFARRFVAFRFWEDLVFAGSIVVAYAPFLLQARSLAPLSLLSLVTVVFGAVSLHHRWARWARPLADEGGIGTTGETQP